MKPMLCDETEAKKPAPSFAACSAGCLQPLNSAHI